MLAPLFGVVAMLWQAGRYFGRETYFALRNVVILVRRLLFSRVMLVLFVIAALYAAYTAWFPPESSSSSADAGLTSNTATPQEDRNNKAPAPSAAAVDECDAFVDDEVVSDGIGNVVDGAAHKGTTVSGGGEGYFSAATGWISDYLFASSAGTDFATAPLQPAALRPRPQRTRADGSVCPLRPPRTKEEPSTAKTGDIAAVSPTDGSSSPAEETPNSGLASWAAGLFSGGAAPAAPPPHHLEQSVVKEKKPRWSIWKKSRRKANKD